MNKEYVNPEEGRIKETEEVYWKGKSIGYVHVVSVFLFTLPVFALILYFSLEEWGDLALTYIGIYIVGVVLIFIISLNPNNRLNEDYLITNKKVILVKAPKKIRYWFTYDEVLRIEIKRNLCDLIFKTATLRLRVIHTTHRRSDLSVVGKSEGHIDMLHIRNYLEVADALKKLRNLGLREKS